MKRRAPTTALLVLALSAAIAGAQLTPVGPEFQVNSYTTGAQYVGGVAIDGSGDFVIVWASYSPGVGLGQRRDAGGTPLGGEFQVNTYTSASPGDLAVAADSAGNFLVVWETFSQDGDGGGVFGQRYD